MTPKALRAPLVALLLAGPGVSGVPATPAPHPRLILTPARIDTLRVAREDTHRELWVTALQSADAFAEVAAPAMANAGNRYRTFGDTLPALGLAYRLTGEKRYVDAADRWLRAMTAVPEWRGSQNLGRSAWAMGAALTYDWLHDALPAATLVAVRDRLAAEGEVLLRETSYWRLLSNHCLIETAALGMIGLSLAGEHERAEAFLRVARERADLIIEHAPRDGSWGEGIQYWQYGLGYFLRYIEAAKTAGHHDYYPRYEWLKRTGMFPIHFSLPGRPAETVNFADSGMNDYFAGFVLHLPASVYRNRYYQDYASRTRPARPYKFSWMDFIAYDASVGATDITALPRFHHFEDNGFVIMRSGWGAADSLLAFHCGPGPGHRNQADPRRLERRGFGPGHAHPDINSFSLFAGGKWLVVDPGYVRQKWTRDENTVLVNGRGQAGEGSVWLDYMAFQNREPAPRIVHAETHDDFDYVVGDAGNIYVDEAGLERFRRHLLFLKPNLVVVFDDLSGRQPATFEWRLQARDPIVQTAPKVFELGASGARLGITALRPAGVTARIEAREIPTASPDRRFTTLSLGTERVGQTVFLVVLAVYDRDGQPPARVEWRAPDLEIEHGGGIRRIRVKEVPGSAEPLLLEVGPALPLRDTTRAQPR